LRIRWLKRALLDLGEAESSISRDNPVAAAEVVLKVVKYVSFLEQQPGLGRHGRVPGTKELVVSGTPYVVPYRVKEDTIQVLRVYHSYRKWPERL